MGRVSLGTASASRVCAEVSVSRERPWSPGLHRLGWVSPAGCRLLGSRVLLPLPPTFSPSGSGTQKVGLPKIRIPGTSQATLEVAFGGVPPCQVAASLANSVCCLEKVTFGLLAYRLGFFSLFVWVFTHFFFFFERALLSSLPKEITIVILKLNCF